MKNDVRRAVKVVSLLFVLFSLMAGTINAGAGADFSPSALSVFREADFGHDMSLSIYVDGALITSLSRGEGYQATVRPGRHVISVTNTPCPYGKTKLTHRRIDFTPGKSYVFTAVWDVETILLEEGHHRPLEWFY